MAALQAQMQAQGRIDVEHHRVRDDTEPFTHALHGDRSDLLGLRLRVAVESRLSRWQQVGQRSPVGPAGSRGHPGRTSPARSRSTLPR